MAGYSDLRDTIKLKKSTYIQISRKPSTALNHVESCRE